MTAIYVLQHMFLWRNKKNENDFGLKKKKSIIARPIHVSKELVYKSLGEL